MSKQWRILVVQDNDYLNRNIVSSLQKDGYVVQGITGGAEAIRLLWAEEYDVVISDQMLPGIDGLELLQWIRTYRPNTRMIMVGAAGSSVTRTQALENGVVSYLEKPIDLHVLKEELRRLLKQTGFSASLDSFDLLDVIQIVNMSHKSIAMVVNTGLEEQGLLGFQDGELVWAEYGVLRGEEAFFALAAYKNGTVTHQPWNAQVRPNVTQPLSRLIFQALQYRSKYAAFKQLTGGQIAVDPAAVATPIPAVQSPGDEDSAFLFVEPILADAQPQPQSQLQAASNDVHVTSTPVQQETNEPAEWWQGPALQGRSNKLEAAGAANGDSASSIMQPVTQDHQVSGEPNGAGTKITPSTVHKTPAGQRTDLPSWLMDQPTQFNIPALRSSSLKGSSKVPARPITKVPPTVTKTAEQSAHKQSSNFPLRQQSSPEWQPPEEIGVRQPQSTDLQSLHLESLASSRKTDDLYSPTAKHMSEPLPANGLTATLSSSPLPENTTLATEVTRSSNWESTKAGAGSNGQRTPKRNYAALVRALQTLGYTIPGFVAIAVVSMDGQPIAQVAVDDLDISRMCGYFSSIMHGVLFLLDQGAQGHYENTIITSTTQRILLRLVGSDRETFQVLITTRESDPVESLKIMANAEAAIESAL